MKNLVKFAFCLILFSGAVRMGFSRGDKIIPQVVAGPGWTTKFDITNISSAQSIGNMWLSFYHNNGTPWVLQTNRGTASDFQLILDPKQTVRIQAIGGGALDTGYAVIYDEEAGNSEYSEDYVLGISVFYQVLTGSGITETVSVPMREVTAAAAMPMEIAAPNIYSAIAVVNSSGVLNSVRLSLYRENGSLYGTANFDLAAYEQRTEFLDQNLFPGLQSFKGMAEITATRPIALLSLLQTRAVGDTAQYTLLAPVDREALRRNTYMVLLQTNDTLFPFMPLDIDGFAVDFYRTTGDPNRLTESYSWDLEYGFNPPNTTSRFLRPVFPAEIVYLGVKSDGDFDALSLPDLKAMTYSTNDINVSSPPVNSTFAILTDLGNYAKARIVRVIDTIGTDSLHYNDLVLEVVVYK